MAGAEVAVALGFGGGGQHRRQRFAGRWPPLAEVGGFVDAPGGLGAADPQPVGQRRGQLATQLGRLGLRAELVDQRVLDGVAGGASRSQRSNTASRSGVVSTSNVRSRARL